MRLIDTNVLLRYVLEDNEEMLVEAEKIIDDGGFALPEIIAEAVYVLTKVYEIEKPDVCSTLRDLFNVRISSDSHREAAMDAAIEGITLNQFVAEAIDEKIARKRAMGAF